jgi:hypothetical protein
MIVVDEPHLQRPIYKRMKRNQINRDSINFMWHEVKCPFNLAAFSTRSQQSTSHAAIAKKAKAEFLAPRATKQDG